MKTSSVVNCGQAQFFFSEFFFCSLSSLRKQFYGKSGEKLEIHSNEPNFYWLQEKSNRPEDCAGGGNGEGDGGMPLQPRVPERRVQRCRACPECAVQQRSLACARSASSSTMFAHYRPTACSAQDTIIMLCAASILVPHHAVPAQCSVVDKFAGLPLLQVAAGCMTSVNETTRHFLLIGLD